MDCYCYKKITRTVSSSHFGCSESLIIRIPFLDKFLQRFTPVFLKKGGIYWQRVSPIRSEQYLRILRVKTGYEIEQFHCIFFPIRKRKNQISSSKESIATFVGLINTIHILERDGIFRQQNIPILELANCI